MNLIRHGETGQEKPGIVLPDGRQVSTGLFGEDFDPEFLQNNGINRLQEWIDKNPDKLPDIDKNTRLGPPIKNPGKIVCIGLNYKDHVKETKAVVPKEPIIFMKATSAITGPFDDVIIPKDSKKTDWEVELAVVIGKKAAYVEEKEAMNYVLGYLLHNDYSEREFQIERGGQWVKGKSCDTFAPLGPWLVTKDEVADVNDLNMWLKVNGEIKQDSNTSNLIFKIPHLVSYISRFMSLHPGDIISTGTPPGVGMGADPPVYLKHWDVVELGIEGLGVQKQRIKDYNKTE